MIFAVKSTSPHSDQSLTLKNIITTHMCVTILLQCCRETLNKHQHQLKIFMCSCWLEDIWVRLCLIYKQPWMQRSFLESLVIIGWYLRWFQLLCVMCPALPPTSFSISVKAKNGGDSHRDRSVTVLTHHHYCVPVSLEFSAARPPIQPIHWWPSGTSQWAVSWSIQKPQKSKYLTAPLYKAPQRQYYG